MLRYSQFPVIIVAILSIDFERDWRHFPAMPDLVAWLDSLFAAEPTKTNAELADALGLNKSAVTRIRNGERQIKAAEIPVICAFFDAASPFGTPGGLAEEEAPFDGAPAGNAPVYRSFAEDGYWRLDRSADPIDERPRAPHFGRAAMVFGLYAPDDAMSPRFKPGEIVWVDPARPARAGEEALFVEAAAIGGAERALLGAYEGERDGRHRYLQYRDGTQHSLDAQKWKALHVLPRY